MNIEIIKETCCNCHISFWITTEHQEQLGKSKKTFYCPNGHPQSYTGETDEQKLKRAERSLSNVREDRDAIVRSNSALRGVITKMRNKK